MSFFGELKHNNVFRVGFKYTDGAWVLIRALPESLPIIKSPGFMMMAINLCLITRLPVVRNFVPARPLTLNGLKLEKDLNPVKSAEAGL